MVEAEFSISVLMVVSIKMTFGSLHQVVVVLLGNHLLTKCLPPIDAQARFRKKLKILQKHSMLLIH